MTKFSKDKVLLLHQYIAAETGGCVGLRDEGLLESALEGAFATFEGKELYPTKEEKAARIGASLVSNHAFLDGNKRISMYVMLTFLEVNGIRVECTDEDIVRAGLSLADGSMDYEKLLAWIREHAVPQEAR
ncbi:MAG: type II toxin-antitoxin system death-on-curing family toxin [Kiritimatiellae bacterium]|nr:type II toxin-antitoxin system death-on-curing family toxin [Kiritimatiellia bacterium]